MTPQKPTKYLCDQAHDSLVIATFFSGMFHLILLLLSLIKHFQIFIFNISIFHFQYFSIDALAAKQFTLNSSGLRSAPKIINLSSFVLAYMIIRLKCLQKSILDYSFKMRIFFKGHLTILQVWIKTYTHANVQRITSFARVTESKLQTTWHEETAEGKNEGKQE